jgi:hypothetical protein
MSPITLPTEKTPPSLTLESAKGLVHGVPKIGKSTLLSQFEDNLFLATEPGLVALEAYQVPVTSWEEFREVGAELAKGTHQFRTVTVDTVGDLLRLCQEHMMGKLGITHPSDLEYGKGWSAVSEEFRLRIGKLASLGLGVWFISHSKDIEIKSKVGSVNKAVPDLGGQSRNFLIGFCDVILYATSQVTEDGEQRVLRTAASENWEAGGRYTLTDPLPLDAAALREDFDRAVQGHQITGAIA